MSDTPRPKYDPDDIHFYTSPWVTGTRAAQYFGPLSSITDYEKPTQIDEALERVLKNLAESCCALGGNALVGIELTINPFADPPTVHVVGTAAELVPLFT